MQLRIGTLKRFLLSVAIASVILTAAQARALGQTPDCHILAVGIDKYSKSPLTGCANDARAVAKLFKGQEGKLFGNVTTNVLVDQEATSDRIGKGLAGIANAGKAGDFVILFFSGHGGPHQSGHWYFVTHNYNGQQHNATALTDATLLQLADQLASQGKKVVLFVDACFSGQLRLHGKNQLNKAYPQGGGVIVMVSSMPSQESGSGQQMSPFAQSVVEGLAGHADLDKDGFVTLREVRRYAYHRTYELARKGKQDGEIDYSQSISEEVKLTAVGKVDVGQAQPQPQTQPQPQPVVVRLAGSNWVGEESLAGFGAVGFHFGANGVAIMIDTAGETRGTWRQNGNRVTMSFFNGQTVYTGTLQGQTLTGTAHSNRSGTWNFTVSLKTN